jgi:hypothetical protein
MAQKLSMSFVPPAWAAGAIAMVPRIVVPRIKNKDAANNFMIYLPFSRFRCPVFTSWTGTSLVLGNRQARPENWPEPCESEIDGSTVSFQIEMSVMPVIRQLAKIMAQTKAFMLKVLNIGYLDIKFSTNE